MERIALMVQCADGTHYAGKGCMDTAGNKGDSATSKAQALFFGWSPNSHQLTHALQPLHLVGAIKAFVIGSSLDSPLPCIRSEQAVSDHPVRAGPRFSRATEQRDEVLADQALPLQATLVVIIHDSAVVEEDHESSRHCSLPLSLSYVVDRQRSHKER